MSEIVTAPEVVPATVPPVAALAAPVVEPPKPAAVPKVEFSAEQQVAINAIVQERIARRDAAQGAKDKTAEDRIADLEARTVKAETAAVSAIIARAAAGTHNPAAVAKLIDLEGLGSDDGAAIEAKVAAFLVENPYLVKAAPTGPFLTPSPGVGATGTVGSLWTEAQLDAVTVEELAGDPAKLKLYADSVAALRA
jgi:hypothetical protein